MLEVEGAVLVVPDSPGDLESLDLHVGFHPKGIFFVVLHSDCGRLCCGLLRLVACVPAWLGVFGGMGCFFLAAAHP